MGHWETQRFTRRRAVVLGALLVASLISRASSAQVYEGAPYVDGGGVIVGRFENLGSSEGNFVNSTGAPFVVPNGFDYASTLPLAEGMPFSTELGTQPQTFGGVPYDYTSADGSGYRILGDVSQEIPIGNSQYDNIPFLEERQFTRPRELPELKVPQNDRELATRIDALVERFSHMPLSIRNTTPGRVLRYSIVGGADQTFLAPESANASEEPGAAAIGELKPIYALGALCWNFPCANRRIMRLSDGKPLATVGYGYQTRRGELLTALAFARVSRDYELNVEGKKFTVQDLVESEKRSCSSQANLSLVAIGLAHYSTNPDEVWRNELGEEWSLKRVLECEMRRPVDWETASSIDKLMAFTYLLARLKQSSHSNVEPLRGELAQTETFLTAIKDRAWEIVGEEPISKALFFQTDGEIDNPYMSLYVNGKLFRWLTLVSSPDEMKSEKMRRANAQICALVDQLFNSLDNLDNLSPTDEESLAVALQTLKLCRAHMPEERRLPNNEPLERAPAESETQQSETAEFTE